MPIRKLAPLAISVVLLALSGCAGAPSTDLPIGRAAIGDEAVPETALHTPEDRSASEAAPRNPDDDSETREAAHAFGRPWKERAHPERYDMLVWQGDDYVRSDGAAMDAAAVGERLGEATATGYDYHADTERALGCEVYAIDTISTECAVAVRLVGDADFYPFINPGYVPATLGDLMDDLDLDRQLVLGPVYLEYWVDGIAVNGDYRYDTYAPLDLDTIRAVLLPSRDTRCEDHYLPSSTYIRIDVPALGVYDAKLGVNRDGYVQTDLLLSGKAFYIGKDKVQDFVDYVSMNGSLINSVTHAYGAPDDAVPT